MVQGMRRRRDPCRRTGLGRRGRSPSPTAARSAPCWSRTSGEGLGRTAGVPALRLFSCLLQLALLCELRRMLNAAPQLVASARVGTRRWLPSPRSQSQQQLGDLLRLLCRLLLLGLQAQSVRLWSCLTQWCLWVLTRTTPEYEIAE